MGCEPYRVELALGSKTSMRKPSVAAGGFVFGAEGGRYRTGYSDGGYLNALGALVCRTAGLRVSPTKAPFNMLDLRMSWGNRRVNMPVRALRDSTRTGKAVLDNAVVKGYVKSRTNRHAG